MSCQEDQIDGGGDDRAGDDLRASLLRALFSDRLRVDDDNGVYRFGNASRSSVVGPGIFNLDFGLYKNFKLSERFTMQFRSEFYNSLNNADFGGAITQNVLSMNLTSGSYGQIQAAAPGREIQFALKLLF